MSTSFSDLQSGPQWSKQLNLNDSEKHNLAILHRGLKPGQRYEVKNGHLHIKLGEKLKTTKKEEAEVKKVISHLVKKITQQKLNDANYTKELQKLFFNKLAKLSDKVFDRKSIDKEFTYVLNPELEKTRKTETNKNDPLRKMNRRMEKARLAIKLGVELKPIGKGCSGSYFTKDFKGKTIGVFKPGVEESQGEHTPKLIPRMVNFIHKVLRIDPTAPFWKNEGYLAEAMSSKLGEHLGYGTVPISKVDELESKKFGSAREKKAATMEKGSIQKFAKNTKSADEALHLYSKKLIIGGLLLKLNMWRYKNFIANALDQKQFEQTALFDLTTCNRDRHFENWLLSPSKTEKDKFDIHLIDNQLAFPKENPPKSDKLYQKYQYKWAVLPQANKPFSDEMKKDYIQNMTGENLKRLISNLSTVNDPHGTGFTTLKNRDFGTSQAIAMKQRIAVIIMAMEHDMTIKDIAKIKTAEDIERFLISRGVSPDERELDIFLKIN